MLSSRLKFLLHFGGLLNLVRTVVALERAVVLRYHSVALPEDRAELYLAPSLILPPLLFEGQLRFLVRHCTVVPLEDLVHRLGQGKKPYRRAVALTFDDGYRDNYTRAFPLLCRYGVPATFYLTTGCIGNRKILWTARLRYLLIASPAEGLWLEKPWGLFLDLSSTAAREKTFATLIAYMKNIPTDQRQDLLALMEERLGASNPPLPLRGMMMSWREVREMCRRGMSFGAHTVTHPNLPNASPVEAEREIRESKEELEGKLGERVDHFAYPNGRGSAHLTEEVKEQVRRAGFFSAVTSLPGCVCQGDDLLALRRMGVYRRHGSLAHFSWDLERSKWKRSARS